MFEFTKLFTVLEIVSLVENLENFCTYFVNFFAIKNYNLCYGVNDKFRFKFKVVIV